MANLATALAQHRAHLKTFQAATGFVRRFLASRALARDLDALLTALVQPQETWDSQDEAAYRWLLEQEDTTTV